MACFSSRKSREHPTRMNRPTGEGEGSSNEIMELRKRLFKLESCDGPYQISEMKFFLYSAKKTNV